MEVGGGFLVRVLQSESRTPQALEFSDRDFPQLVASAIAARGEKARSRATSTLMPGGYEACLRSLGHRLDTQVAEAITISELDSFVVLGGIAMVDTLAQTSLAPFQAFLKVDDLALLVDSAVRQRAGAKQGASPLDRWLGRLRT